MRRFCAVLFLVALMTPIAAAADKDIPEGFQSLYNGKDLEGWKVFGGKMENWGADGDVLFVKGGGGGWLMTEKEYGDFELRLEFKLPKAGNSGVALRAPREGNPAYQGMEIQLLDDPWYKDETHYKGIHQSQLTGSIYDVVPPSKDATKPAGEWNKIHITAKGPHISIELNGAKTIGGAITNSPERERRIDPRAGRKGCSAINIEPGRIVHFKIRRDDRT